MQTNHDTTVFIEPRPADSNAHGSLQPPCIGASTPETGVVSKHKPEQELIDQFKLKFEKCFVRIDEEVWDDTNKNRIDMVLYPNADTALGIEFKRFDKRKHGNELGKWLRQATRYSEARFPHRFHGKYERIPIFVCPSITHTHLIFNPDVHVKENMINVSFSNDGMKLTPNTNTPHYEHNNINSFLFAAFGIGEIRKLSESETIFSSNCLNVASLRMFNGKWKCFVHANKYRILMNQLNSRP